MNTLRLIKSDEETLVVKPISEAAHIIPTVGDSVKVRSEWYEVIHVTYDFDDGIVTVDLA